MKNLFLIFLIYLFSINSQDANKSISIIPRSTDSSDNSEASNDKTSDNDNPTKTKLKLPSNAARGTITMKEPPVAESYTPGFILGSKAKFVWSYDETLKIKPDKISMIAIRQDPQLIIYNISLNMTGSSTNYTWDTEKFMKDPSNPPLVEANNYRLFIFDSSRPYTGGAPPGELTPFSRMFKLYKTSDGNLCEMCLSSGMKIKPSYLGLFSLFIFSIINLY